MASVEENLGGEVYTVVHSMCSCGSPGYVHDAKERAPYYKIRWENLENIKRILTTPIKAC